MFSVFIVDDHMYYSCMVESLLLKHDIFVAGRASCEKFIKFRLPVEPDILVISFRGSYIPAFKALTCSKNVYPESKVLIYGCIEDKPYIDKYVRQRKRINGAIFNLENNPNEIAKAITIIYEGGFYFDS